jgi:hypothetical protein
MKAKSPTKLPIIPKPAALEAQTSLTKEEAEKLAKLEAVVERHVQSFFDAVEAMRTIKSENLWRGDYRSWEDYVERKWRMSRQHSYRLLDAGGIIEAVKTVTQGDAHPVRLPASERPYREIGELLEKNAKPEQVVKLLKMANTYTGNTRDIEPGDIHKAALELKLIAKPAKVVFELKAEWRRIRDGLAGVVKVLEKHADLQEQTAQLKELLQQVEEAVKHCPIAPKTTGKTAIKGETRRKEPARRSRQG